MRHQAFESLHRSVRLNRRGERGNVRFCRVNFARGVSFFLLICSPIASSFEYFNYPHRQKFLYLYDRLANFECYCSEAFGNRTYFVEERRITNIYGSICTGGFSSFSFLVDEYGDNNLSTEYKVELSLGEPRLYSTSRCFS